jgi:hypothetical protein
MLTIRLHIRKVIEDIDTGRDQTKERETFQCMQERIEQKELFVKDESGKDEDIFGPLTRTHGFDQGG